MCVEVLDDPGGKAAPLCRLKESSTPTVLNQNARAHTTHSAQNVELDLKGL